MLSIFSGLVTDTMLQVLVHNHPVHGEQIHFIDWEHHHATESKVRAIAFCLIDCY